MTFDDSRNAPKHGHNPGTVGAESIAPQGRAKRTLDCESSALPGWPRLMSVELAAAYVGLSRWMLEQYIADGTLRVIHPPRPRTAKAYRARPTRGRKASRPTGDQLRRTLFDRADLDDFVNRIKGANYQGGAE